MRLLSICLYFFAGITILHLLVTPGVVYEVADAFDASSTSFFVRQLPISSGAANSTYSFSTSTSFKFLGVAGENGIGTSTSSTFGLLGGYMRNMYKGPAPTYTQIHYHWRNDDGTETTATSKTSSVQDTDITDLAKSTAVRLRLEVSNEGGTLLGYSTQQFRLEYGLKSTTCAAIVSWTDVGAGAGDWDMYDSSNLTESANTTNIAIAVGGVANENNAFISTNAGVKDTSSQTSAVSVSSDSFIELEYSIQALTASTAGGTYCFRVTNASSATNYSYTVYPQASISGGTQTLSFSISGNTIGFGALSSAAARYGTADGVGSASETEAHQLAASTNGASGYTITVQGATMTSQQNSANTVTAIGGTNTTSSVGTEQFGLRMTATGGVGAVSSPYAASGFAYAGTAGASSQVASASSGDSVTTTYSVRYIANVGSLTEAGSYTANLIYVATANF